MISAPTAVAIATAIVPRMIRMIDAMTAMIRGLW